MTLSGWVQIVIYFTLILLVTKPLGIYLYRVLESDGRPLHRVFGGFERAIYRICNIKEVHEQSWKEYAVSLFVFSIVGIFITFFIQKIQRLLPLNPQAIDTVTSDLAFNTAVSFVTNTNWQAYPGESTMTYLTQMTVLTWQNFVSAASGIGVAFALMRGLTGGPSLNGKITVGNFWVDLIRSVIYVLLPLSILAAVFFVSQGIIQNLNGYRETVTLEGVKQIIAMGPVASQEAIKELGTNGGGFFNANSAHPFENPTPLTNFIQILLIFSIPAALTYTFGMMTKNSREGWIIFGVMAFLFLLGVSILYWAESQPNPALAGLPLDHESGNMEGKEVRFGSAASALFAAVTTAASCGAVNAVHDSFTPIGGIVPLTNILLGEVVFGGVGAGMYGILIFAVLTVFISGLMVGRTPEYLGKKIELKEMQYAVIYALIFPFLILVFSALSTALSLGASSITNSGPHGLSEILYAYASGAGNNGSAFAGLNSNTPWWNITMGIVMLAGRFLMILPVLALSGSMVVKKTIPAGQGTFPTTSILFAILLTGVILIVGALTFFPVLTLGPIVEHFLAIEGRQF